MTVYDVVKDAISLVQNMGNTPLYSKLIEIQKQVLELLVENKRLEDEKKQLEMKLKTRGLMIYKKDFAAYFLKSENPLDDGPYCQTCYEIEGLLIHTLQYDAIGKVHQCPKCKNIIAANL